MALTLEDAFAVRPRLLLAGDRPAARASRFGGGGTVRCWRCGRLLSDCLCPWKALRR